MDWVEGAALSQWLAAHSEKASQLVLVSPFITQSGLEHVLARLKNKRRNFHLTILTELSIASVLLNLLDLDILESLLADSTERHQIVLHDIPGLHAKVFLFDREAVVGSGNLTQAGTGGSNIEIGIRISKKSDIEELKDCIQRWQFGKSPIQSSDISRLRTIIERDFSRYKNLSNDIVRFSPNQLQIFPGNEGYFSTVKNVLMLAKARGGCSRERMLQLLRGETVGTKGSGTPHSRLLFLEYHDIVEQKENHVCITEFGQTFLSRNGSTDFAMLLRKHFPSIAQLWAAFLLDPTRGWTYKELKAEFPALSSDRNGELIENSVRWLRSLGIVEEVTGEGREIHHRYVRPPQKRNKQE